MGEALPVSLRITTLNALVLEQEEVNEADGQGSAEFLRM